MLFFGGGRGVLEVYCFGVGQGVKGIATVTFEGFTVMVMHYSICNSQWSLLLLCPCQFIEISELHQNVRYFSCIFYFIFSI